MGVINAIIAYLCFAAVCGFLVLSRTNCHSVSPTPNGINLLPTDILAAQLDAIFEINNQLMDNRLANDRLINGRRRHKRQRQQQGGISASDKCRVMPEYITVLCFAIKKGFSWVFASEQAAYVFDACYNALAVEARRRKRKRRRREIDVEAEQFEELKVTLTGKNKDYFSHFEMQMFFTAFTASSRGGHITGSRRQQKQMISLHQHQRQPKHHDSRGINSFNSTRVCIKFISYTAKMCQFFLHKSVSNNQTNFAWICIFSSDPTMTCHQLVKALGRLCMLDLEHSDFDYEGLAVTNDGSDAGSGSVSLPIALNPIETCKSFAPSLFAVCRYFQLPTKEIFGGAVGHILENICRTYFDGFIHLIPWHWFQVGKGILANPMESAVEMNLDKDNPDVVAWNQEALREMGLEQDAMAHQHHRGLLDAFNGLMGFVNMTTLKLCTAVVELVSPLCKKLGGGDGGFARWSWVCLIGGQYAGACLLFLNGAAGLCKADLSACDASLEPSAFSCARKPAGYYADPVHQCANFYYHCRSNRGDNDNEPPLAIPCHGGSNFVYVAAQHNCRRRIEVSDCHSQRSPCLPSPPVELTKTGGFADFAELSCDPLLPPPTAEQLEAVLEIIAKSSADIERRRQSKITGASRLSCQGKDDGLHPVSGTQCSPLYLECRNGALTESICEGGHAMVFDHESATCRPRSDIFGCLRPPCPADHYLRRQCNPDVPRLSPGYDLQTYRFNCTGRPYGIYADPYDRCAQHFYVCKEEMRFGVLGTGATVSSRMTCNVHNDNVQRVYVEPLLKCIPKVNVEECWNYKPPCPANNENGQ